MITFHATKSGDQGPDNDLLYSGTIEDCSQLLPAQRHVEIIPELDIPGHTAAVLAVFPEMLCQSLNTVPVQIGKTTDVMMCGSERLFRHISKCF